MGSRADEELLRRLGGEPRSDAPGATPHGHATVRLSDGAALQVQNDLLELPLLQTPEIRFQDDLGSSGPDSLTPEQPHRYAASFEVGRGGIGRVYIASDRHLNRSVAVKELLLGSNGKDQAEWRQQTELRFVREARITGQLEHPNIIGVHELGKRPDGTIYYTMPVIQGRTLAVAIEECSSLGARLNLMNHFRGACQAVAYAHSRGVIHRDIKPDNIMIGQFGETIVLDWGLAKVTDAETLSGPGSIPFERPSLSGRALSLSPPERALDPIRGGGALRTLVGTIFGTPAFMSPEQALGQVDELDERTDVWSLGAVLFTIISGNPPFDGANPKQIIARVLSGSLPKLQETIPDVPAELDAITRRALCRDLDQRYASAAELLRDIESYLSGARVGAHSYSIGESVARSVRKHRAAFGVAAAAAISLVTFGVVYQIKLVRARDTAVLAQQTAQQSAKDAAHSAHLAQLNLASLLVEKATASARRGDSVSARKLAEEALAIEEEPQARGIMIAGANLPSPKLEVQGKFSQACTQVSMDSQALRVACLAPPQIEVWNTFTGVLEWKSNVGLGDPFLVHALPGSGVILISRGGLVQEISDGKVRSFPPIAAELGAPLRSALAPDARSVALATSTGRILVLDLERGSYSSKAEGQPEASALGFSPDARTLAVGGKRGDLLLLSLDTGRKREFMPHSGSIVALSFSPDGRFLATGSSDRSAKLWSVKTLEEASRGIPSDGAVSALDWSNDGRFFALGSDDRSVRVVDLREPSFGLSLPPDTGPVRALQFAADSTRIVSMTEHTFSSWRRRPALLPTRLVQRSNMLSLRFDRTGQVLAGGLRETGVCAFDLREDRCATHLPVDLAEVRTLSLEPKRRWLAAGGTGGDTTLWDLDTKLPLRVFAGHPGGTRGSAFSSAGRYLATVGKNGSVSIFEASSGILVFSETLPCGLSAVVWSEPQQSFLLGRLDGQLQYVHPATQRLMPPFPAHSDWTLALDVTEDNSRFLSAGADGRILIWNAKTTHQLMAFAPQPGRVFAAAFSPDGRFVASGGEGNVVFLWDAESGQLLASLLDHQGPIRAVRFAPGRSLLASASDDGSVRLWDLSGVAASSGRRASLQGSKATPRSNRVFR